MASQSRLYISSTGGDNPMPILQTPDSEHTSTFGPSHNEKLTACIRSQSSISKSSEPITQSTSRSASTLDDNSPSHKHHHHHGLYWRSPALMVGSLALGIIASVSHHFYYASLVDKTVGNNYQQQWVFRWGSTFAYIAQVCLAFSVGIAYTQWLWKSLNNKDTRVSINCLDAAFVADTTIISLLNRELLWKLKIGSVLALVAWCLPIPSLVTPGTLFVLPSMQNIHSTVNVSSLDMYGPNQQLLFTYSVPLNLTDELNSNYDNDEIFLGPRTVISRLSTATATQGQILPIKPPFPNSSYDLQFHAPYVQCSEADTNTATLIETFRTQSVSNFTEPITEVANYYYAFVPNLSDFGNTSLENEGVTLLPQVRLEQPSNGSNQLWMAYSQYYFNEMGQQDIRDHYTVCTLYNASYNLALSFEEGVQRITKKSLDILDSVPYPRNDALLSTDLMVQHAYTAYMWALTELLVGSMGVFTQAPSSPELPPANFTQIASQIAYTALLGSSDLDVFFDKGHAITSGPNSTTPTSGQRLQDIDLAYNRTLDMLIETLSWNITVSLMNSDLLSPPTPKQITYTTPINIYAYHASSLVLAYGLAILFAVVANLLGGYAYHKNGVSHDKSFSAIMAATRAPEIERLLPVDVRGRIPLPNKVVDTELRFVDLEGGGKEFRVVV